MGLMIDDLEDWFAWSRRQGRAKAVAARLRHPRRRNEPPPAFLLLPSQEPTTLVVIDKLSVSCRWAMAAPLAHLDPERTAVLSALDEARELVDWPTHEVSWRRGGPLPHSVEQVFTLGAYNDLAGPAREWARRREARHCVVQHGLITPWAPPLAPGDHFLAWSQDDADFQTDGRSDVTSEVVGSQMFWHAAHLPPAELVDDRPVLLGQLHGVELGRREEQRIYIQFCRDTGAQYRPHPNEADAVSRLQHRVMHRAGVEFETSGRPVIDLGRPVVSIFSTGTLEAAQRGLPAWVVHPDPPAWVSEFWQRYGLSPWGEEPTLPVPLPAREPSSAIASALQN